MQKEENGYPKFIPYISGVNNLQASTVKMDIKEYGKEQPARWLSVDPMVNNYPGWSPYNYTLNNPLLLIDPNGMWTSSIDKNGRITANYEKGDTYANLYSQMGMDMKQFTDWATSNGIDIPLDASGSSFDITDRIVSNSNYDTNNEGSNCFGFVSFAGLGIGSKENALDQLDVSSIQMTSNPQTGNVAIFNMDGQYQYKGQESPVNASGIQGHGAIFVLNNKAGEAQYLNRENTGLPVTINTQSQIVSFFANPNNAAGGASAYIILPKLNPNPVFYSK